MSEEYKMPALKIDSRQWSHLRSANWRRPGGIVVLGASKKADEIETEEIDPEIREKVEESSDE